MDELSEHERRQMEEIRQLDMEELHVEEVDFESSSSSDDDLLRNSHDDQIGTSDFNFNTGLAPMHTYLGEVDDAHSTLSILEGGKIMILPMFYLQGVVLFPGATLPLKIVEYQFIASFLKALNQVDAPCTLGVIRVVGNPYDARRKYSVIGTTAEIKQYRRLEDGSINVFTRGQQRFRLIRRFTDNNGAPCAEVKILEEGTPQRTPRDAFAKLASVPVSNPNPSSNFSPIKPFRFDIDEDLTSPVTPSTSSRKEKTKKCLFGSPCSDFSYEYHGHDDKSSSGGDEEELGFPNSETKSMDIMKEKMKRRYGVRRHGFAAPMTYWPKWVYDMFDSYTLARRAAELWREIIVKPNLDEFVRKPEILSFYIASKLPLSESTRQELLEIDGVSYRLRREIQLLKDFNHIRCKNCMTLVAKRSDMVTMSSDGPLNAYVNTHGYVHEVITVHNANGLVLQGQPVKEHSWFPGYAWTITSCASCESNIGWLFTAVRKNLLPRSFWGIRSSQVADDTHCEQR